MSTMTGPLTPVPATKRARSGEDVATATPHVTKKAGNARAQRRRQVTSSTSVVPLSRDSLLSRLSTFSPLTWTANDVLSPLVCAVQGWISHDNHQRKNELYCSSCQAILMVKLPQDDQHLLDLSEDEELGVSIGYGSILNEHPKLGLDDEEYDDDDDLASLTNTHNNTNDDDEANSTFYQSLVNSYTKRLMLEHHPKCAFLPLIPLKPEDQDYYITPKDLPRELHAFNSRFKVIQKYQSLLNDTKFKQFPKPLENSKLAYCIAILGWSIKVQFFAKDCICLLKCDYCCKRILLSPQVKLDTFDIDGLEKLPDCPYPISITNVDDGINVDEFGIGGNIIYDEPSITEIDLYEEHANWCCIRKDWELVHNNIH